MKSYQVVAIGLIVACLLAGCGKAETRDPNAYAGPVVNPQAPGIVGAHKTFGHSGRLYTAPPGTQTGIPK